MDVDPLSDTQPPRHAIESDSEEDEFNPISFVDGSRSKSARETDVKFVGDVRTERALIIAVGDVGRVWGAGAKLGEQFGAVMVNGKQVGLFFTPQWTEANVIIIGATSPLAVPDMHQFAWSIVEHISPSAVVLLDSYIPAEYIHPEARPIGDPPIRYLGLQKIPALDESFMPFATPNLVHTSSAAFMSVLAVRSERSSPTSSDLAAVILLPASDLIVAISDVVRKGISEVIREQITVQWEFTELDDGMYI